MPLLNQPPSPIDLSVSLGSNRKMSLKIGDGKPLAANVTSNNKLQLKFKNSQFVGEYFHYSGDLFLIGTTRTADLCAQLISERPPSRRSCN